MERKHRKRTRCRLPERNNEGGSGDARPEIRTGQSEPPSSIDDYVTLISKKVRTLNLQEKQDYSEETPVNDPENTHGLQPGGPHYSKDSRSDTSVDESSAPYRKYARANFSKTPSASSNEPKQRASHKELSASHEVPSASHQQENASYSQYPSASYDERLPSYEDECGNDEELCAIYKKKRTSYEEGPSVRYNVGCVQLLDSASYSAWKSHKKKKQCHDSGEDTDCYSVDENTKEVSRHRRRRKTRRGKKKKRFYHRSDATDYFDVPPHRSNSVDENTTEATHHQSNVREIATRTKLSFSEIEDEHLCYRLQNLTLDDKREMAAGKKRKLDDFQQDEVSVKIRRLPKEYAITKWRTLE